MPNQDSLKLYEHIFASLSSGIVAVDTEGVITLRNASACTQLELDEGDLPLGSTLGDIAPLAPFEALRVESLAQAETIARREVSIPCGGAPRVFGVTASLLREDNGTPAGHALLFSDLTHVKELERQAEVHRQLAQIGELTAGVVHELRSPLSVISGMAELLERRLAGQPEPLRRVDKILEEVAQLEKLINHFLSFAKPVVVEHTALAPLLLLNRTVELCARLAEERGVTLTIDCPADLPAIVVDETKMAQALSNLVRNAIEVCDEGGAVCLEARAEDDLALLRVSDTGPGIQLLPGEDLFSPFFSKKEGGTGLGLAIVQRIVSAHQGEIRHANRSEGGAQFEIQLPLS